MRLLIYLLAMITGFSAAEAARPVSATPATVAQSAIVVASEITAQQHAGARSIHKAPILQQVAALPVYVNLPIVAASPVSRRDIIRE